MREWMGHPAYMVCESVCGLVWSAPCYLCSAIVPRGAFGGEWDGRGMVCWMWLVLSGMNLRGIMRFCACVQRMENMRSEGNYSRGRLQLCRCGLQMSRRWRKEAWLCRSRSGRGWSPRCQFCLCLPAPYANWNALGIAAGTPAGFGLRTNSIHVSGA